LKKVQEKSFNDYTLQFDDKKGSDDTSNFRNQDDYTDRDDDYNQNNNIDSSSTKHVGSKDTTFFLTNAKELHLSKKN